MFIVIVSLTTRKLDFYCLNLFPQKHLFLATIIYLFSPAFNCGGLGPPTKGQLRLTSSTTVTYTCNTGYILHGASTRHCTANGEWTGSAPQCIRELRVTIIHQIDSVYRLIVRLIRKVYLYPHRLPLIKKCLNYINTDVPNGVGM